MVQPLIKAIILYSLNRICLAHCLVPGETNSDKAIDQCMLLSLWSLACDWLAAYEKFLKTQKLFAKIGHDNMKAQDHLWYSIQTV